MLSRPRLSVAAEERTSLDSICARWPQPCGGRGGRKAWLSRTRERDKENGDEHGNLNQSPAEVCERMEEMEKRSSGASEPCWHSLPVEAWALIRSAARAYP